MEALKLIMRGYGLDCVENENILPGKDKQKNNLKNAFFSFLSFAAALQEVNKNRFVMGYNKKCEILC